jgi:quinoprotein glucose dehydrogenase
VRYLSGLIVVSVLAAAVAVRTQTDTGATTPPPYTTWTTYLGGAHSSQYSALDRINRSTVTQLQVAWSFPAGTRTNYFNPIVVDGVMYVLARANELVALDAATGRELWARPHEGAVSGRGINYWESPDRSDRRLLYLNSGALTAVDARTGRTILSFGTDGRVDLRDGLAASGRDITGVTPLGTNNPGRVFEDLMIVSLPAQGAGYESTPGDVHAYDVRTGELRWVFHSIPRPGEFGADTWPADIGHRRGGVHNWSELTVDAARGIVYIPFGSPRFDY